MAITGSAIGAALSELKGEVELNAHLEIHSDKIKTDLENISTHKSRDITHHYKITRTHSDVVEVDDVSTLDKLATDDKKISEGKKKRSGCFSACFGKKS